MRPAEQPISPWPLPPDEAERLAELDSFEISAARESDLDQIVQLASDLLDAPIALLNLIHSDHLRVKARVGIDADRVPRDVAFCSHTILQPGVMVVEDLGQDERFTQNPLVTGDAHLRFYAGAPLRTSEGHNIGTLCVLDREARPALTSKQCRVLTRLADLVVDKLAMRRLQLADVVASQFAKTTSEAFLCVNSHGVIRFWNDAAERLFGWSRTEAIGRGLDLIVPERFRGAHSVGMSRVAGGVSSKLAGRPLELVAKRQDGSEFPVELVISVWDHEGARGMGAVLRDLSERKNQQRRLEYMAHHDQLTGLANRFDFTRRLEDALASDMPSSILTLDLDGFKAVNDSLGHSYGDTLLKSLAIRLLGSLDPTMPIARLGGDEFAILMPGCGSPFEAAQLAQALLELASQPFVIEGQSILINMSVGIAQTGLVGRDMHQLMSAADLALYAAKAAGKRSYRFFEPYMRERFVTRRRLLSELEHAAQTGGFIVHYQPQVALSSGALIGCEALLRWDHPERGLLYPGAFIDALNVADCAAEVGWWVLDEACRQIVIWERAGLKVGCIGVNLFAAQLQGSDFFVRVRDALVRHGLAPHRLELEITESIALEQGDAAIAHLEDVRRLGVGLAFDDFGTGFASLSTIKRIPLTRLKIDRSFVSELMTQGHDTAIVRAIVSMAANLKLGVIAEGIEERSQVLSLQQLGCGEGQGFLYGKGLPSAQFYQQFSGGAAAVA